MGEEKIINGQERDKKLKQFETVINNRIFNISDNYKYKDKRKKQINKNMQLN